MNNQHLQYSATYFLCLFPVYNQTRKVRSEVRKQSVRTEFRHAIQSAEFSAVT